MPSLRDAYPLWPTYNTRLIDAVRDLSPEEVRLMPAEGRWPLWATVGHLACQRVFSFCDFAGEPGVETTPFPNAGYNCPGDDDLENVFEGAQLASALKSTFAIIERCLDTWPIDSLEQVITRTWPSGETRTTTRGKLLQRSFAHDFSHIVEVNDSLVGWGLRQVELWD